MSVLKREQLTEGLRLSALREDDKWEIPLCHCGRKWKRCTVAQSLNVKIDKGSRKPIHEDLTYADIESKYFNWLILHGHLLITHGLDTIDK